MREPQMRGSFHVPRKSLTELIREVRRLAKQESIKRMASAIKEELHE